MKVLFSVNSLIRLIRPPVIVLCPVSINVTRQGSAFCSNVEPLWQQVMASRNGAELARLHQERNIGSIHGLEPCATRKATPPLLQVRGPVAPKKVQPQPAVRRSQVPQQGRMQTAQR